MMFFLQSIPCPGGFYLGSDLMGLTFSNFMTSKKNPPLKKEDCEKDRCAWGYSFNFSGGYGLVTGGKYKGFRMRIGKDFGRPGCEFFMPAFIDLQALIGLYLTPSNLFYCAPGITIAWNHHQTQSSAIPDWGWAISSGSRIMITGHMYCQIEGTFLYHNKAAKNQTQSIDFNKRALRFCVGGGYNF